MKVLNRNELPLCFDTRADFEGWRAHVMRGEAHSWICTDCTKEYAAQMKQEGRCVQPNVKFRNGDGFAKWLSQEQYDTQLRKLEAQKKRKELAKQREALKAQKAIAKRMEAEYRKSMRRK